MREQVSIRDLPTILETLLDTSAISKNPVLLVEAARQALGRALVRPLLSDDGGLRVLTLDHKIEEELSRAFNPQAAPATSTGLQPSFVRRILDGLRQLAGDQVAQTAPILLCSTPARFHLRRLLEPFLPKDRRALPLGNSSHDFCAVAGDGEVRTSAAIRQTWPSAVGRSGAVCE